MISGNSFVSIEFDGANGSYDNALIGSSICVDTTGTNLLGNGSYGSSINFASANTLVARNWIVGNATAIRFFAIGGFGSNSTASFINNANGANPALPALDSSRNCVLASSGVTEDPQGSIVPTTTFAGNWWDASSGPNTAGASSADSAVIAAPFLLAQRRRAARRFSRTASNRCKRSMPMTVYSPTVVWSVHHAASQHA